MVDYDYGFINPMAVPHRALRDDYDIFGARKRPGHGGLDLYSPDGSEIVAPADGTVRFSGFGSSSAGWLVEILHPGHPNRGQTGFLDWYLSRSMHMNERPVAVAGAAILAGTVIGRVGKTGNANSPHNHFEIRWTDANDADKWTMYGTGWGTRYDPAAFGILDDPALPPALGEITVDRPFLAVTAPPYSKDMAVQELQYLLAVRGFIDTTPGVNLNAVTGQFDGLFGPSTASGVKNYQISKGLLADGKVGTATWSVLLDY